MDNERRNSRDEEKARSNRRKCVEATMVGEESGGVKHTQTRVTSSGMSSSSLREVGSRYPGTRQLLNPDYRSLSSPQNLQISFTHPPESEDEQVSGLCAVWTVSNPCSLRRNEECETLHHGWLGRGKEVGRKKL